MKSIIYQQPYLWVPTRTLLRSITIISKSTSKNCVSVQKISRHTLSTKFPEQKTREKQVTEPNKQSNSPNGQVGPSTPSNSPVRRVASSTPSNSPVRRVGSSTPSNSPVRQVGPSTPSKSPVRRVGPNTPSNSPARRVGPTLPDSPWTGPCAFCRTSTDQSLISYRSELPWELYNKNGKDSFPRIKFMVIV